MKGIISVSEIFTKSHSTAYLHGADAVAKPVASVARNHKSQQAYVEAAFGNRKGISCRMLADFQKLTLVVVIIISMPVASCGI